jgi:hypothetical protein
MSGAARRAAAATVIATTLVVSATAYASPPPTLTGKFPLGTKTLSHGSPTPAPKQPSPSPKHSQTAAKQPSPAPTHSSPAPKRSGTTPATGRQAASKGTLIVIAVVLAVLLAGFANWVVVRGSRGTDPRRRRRIPLLRSLPRHNGVRVSPIDEDDTDGDEPAAADEPVLPIMPGPAQPTPDPFKPRSPTRAHPRRDDRNGAQDEQAPKPVIRTRQN